MTETAAPIGVKNLSFFCSDSVVTTGRTEKRHGLSLGAFAFGALMFSAPALAGTLAEFEARCLTPMVEVRESDLSGLERIPHRAAWESWVPAEGDWELRRALPGAVVQYCAIIGDYTWEESGAWADAAVASGDYEVIETEPLRLHSTFIREPVIEVEFDMTVPSVTVIETNLES
ncbi:hypothetical protein [Gymnodinialimonas hymeniacidonis]|uniref:hypothetical protein n=1 Tax=Gymnodinialimonas hymeniacidonis TaxID=3126508 RepID=UPI0034C68863